MSSPLSGAACWASDALSAASIWALSMPASSADSGLASRHPPLQTCQDVAGARRMLVAGSAG